MPGFKPGKAGGKGASAKSKDKLSGGHWVTIMGRATYIKAGKIVHGGPPGMAKEVGKSGHGAGGAKGGGKADKGASAKGEGKPAGPARPVHDRVAESSSHAAASKTAHATEHLKSLHADIKAGKHDGTSAHKHVDRIARGTKKAELFDAAKGAGVEHAAKTKKDLVTHLKSHAEGLAKGETKPADRPAAKPEHAPAKAEAPGAAPPKAEPKIAPRATTKASPKATPEPAKPAGHAGTVPEKSRASFNRKDSELDEAGLERHASRLLGKAVKREDVASMVGAPHDAKIHVSGVTADSLEITTRSNGYYSVRQIRRGSDGKPYIKNEFSEVTAQGKGTGTKVFGDQVAHASAHGIDRIEMIAARSFKADGSDSLVGYKVWPKFGFDAPIHPEIRDKFPRSLRKAKNISDLMKTEEGRAAWVKHGGSERMNFDLKPGSPSHKIWDAYRAAKAAKGG